MICPHCSIGTDPYFEESTVWGVEFLEARERKGYSIIWGHCTECDHLIVIYQRGFVEFSSDPATLDEDRLSESLIIYPRHSVRPIASEVPTEYKDDFHEACSVLAISPKASAALSRRLLQKILQVKFGIQQPNLAREIEEFIKLKDVPSYLAEAIDAIRNVGNFAAHPMKDTNTGAIVDVEPGEAEWLLDVTEAMFDFAFIQPARLQKMKQGLDAKLKAVGRPPMKQPKK
jgi:hypothetical protein